MPRLYRSRGGELVDVVCAEGGTVQACFDAVAFVFDLGEGEVDFGGDASDVEAAGVADTAMVVGFEVGADWFEAFGVGEGGEGEEGEGEKGGGETHGES